MSVGSAIGTSLSCEDEALLRACYMLVAHGTLSKDVPTVGADAADEYNKEAPYFRALPPPMPCSRPASDKPKL